MVGEIALAISPTRLSCNSVGGGKAPTLTLREVLPMRYIDAFNHFFPKRFFAGVLDTPAAQKDMGKRIRGIPALFDLDERLRIVDSFPDYSQILSLAMPAIDRLWDANAAPEWARIGNDELAELAAKDPGRFPGWAASLPMNAPAAAAREAARALAK